MRPVVTWGMRWESSFACQAGWGTILVPAQLVARLQVKQSLLALHFPQPALTSPGANRESSPPPRGHLFACPSSRDANENKPLWADLKVPNSGTIPTPQQHCTFLSSTSELALHTRGYGEYVTGGTSVWTLPMAVTPHSPSHMVLVRCS